MDVNQLPEYRCHKIVRGAEIASCNVIANTVQVTIYEPALDTAIISVPPEFFARGVPAPGDFLVVYDGGYLSWSPRKAWDDGYARLHRGQVTHGDRVHDLLLKLNPTQPQSYIQVMGEVIFAAEQAIDAVRAGMPKVETPPPVNEASPSITLADGSPVTPDHRHLQPNGQQKGYVVLSAEERAKGFVRPVRASYRHLKCGTETRMSQTIAETYARNPEFYSGTFCCGCRDHFPVGADGEFVWSGTDEKVGT